MDAATAGIVGGAVGAAIGGGLALVNGAVTQTRLDRREREARQREEANRSYAERRMSYLQFMKEWNEKYEAVFFAKLMNRGSEPPEDYLSPLYSCLEQVRIFGSRRAGEIASHAYDVLREYTYRGGEEPDNVPLDTLRQQVRRDLGVPDDPGALGGPHR